MIKEMDVFNMDKSEETKEEIRNINSKVILAYNEKVKEGFKGELLDFLKDEGYEGLCYIEQLAPNNTYNLAMIQSYFGTRKLFVELKGENAGTLQPCLIDAVLKIGENKAEMKPSVKVLVNDKKIKLGDIVKVAVNLNETVKLLKDIKKEELEKKLAELKMDKLNPVIKDLVTQAIQENLDYEYVATIKPKYNFLEFVLPFLKHKLHVTDYLKDSNSADLNKVIVYAVENLGSRVKQLDLTRPAQLLVIDIMCIKSGFKLYDVYDESDNLETAKKKLLEQTAIRNKQIYYASFDKRNSSFVDFPIDLFEAYVNLVKNYNGKKELKLDIRGFMLANNLEGIYKLPITVEDFVNNEELRMEFNVNNSCLVSLKNTPIMMRNLVVSEGELFTKINKLDKENWESIYIECLPATEDRIRKCKELCKELELPYAQPVITEDVISKYLNDTKEQDGRFMSFTRMLREEGLTGLVSVDLSIDKEKLALCLKDCSAKVTWYDKNYGFRTCQTEIIVIVGSTGNHIVKIKFDKFNIPMSKFVKLSIDVDFESNRADLMKQMLLQEYEDSLRK